MSESDALPPDFEAALYLAYHRDVAAAGMDAAAHYLAHGRREGRLYRRADIARAGGAGAAREPYAYANLHPGEARPDLALARFAATPCHSQRALDRIVAAYHHSLALGPNNAHGGEGADLWTGIVDVHLRPLAACLERRDTAALAELLSKLGAEYTWFGGITTGLDGYNHWDRDERAVAHAYFDKLVALAEAVGVLPVENPEQGLAGNWGKNLTRAPERIVELIEVRLGISLRPPLGILPVVGLKVGESALHYRHINALYAALRVTQLSEGADALCEYGGGIGLVALYAARLGRKNYTLFDLPIVNVISGYMLMMSLGEDAVALEGESARDDQVRVRIGPSSRLEPAAKFTLALNQDSFPEIDRVIVLDYLAQIARTTTRYFLSINHEVEHTTTGAARHLNVSSLLQGRSDFTLRYRMPYWLRRGYVEELYAL